MFTIARLSPNPTKLMDAMATLRVSCMQMRKCSSLRLPSYGAVVPPHVAARDQHDHPKRDEHEPTTTAIPPAALPPTAFEDAQSWPVMAVAPVRRCCC